MKRTMLYIALALAPVLLVAFRPIATLEAHAPAAAAITFESTSQQLGQIPQGKPVEVVFGFRNSGSDVLIISAAKGSCGCTQVEFPTEPIAPGATATIRGTYDAAKVGVFNKSIAVTSNAAEAPTQLTFSGEVVK
jgi:hypothetical protein